MIMSTKEICKRGLSMTISLTLGNTIFPFGNSLITDGKGICKLPLCEISGFSGFGNKLTDSDLIHGVPPLYFTL